MANAKIDIKIGEIEISLEGPEDFVEVQYNKITDQLDAFQNMNAEVAPEPLKPGPSAPTPPASTTKTTKKKPGPKPGTKRKSGKKPGPKPKAKAKAKTTTTKTAAATKTKTKPGPKAKAKAKTGTTTKATNLPKSFDQWLKMAPAKLNKTDSALLAGFYIQLNSDKGSFRVREASKVLRNNNINLSNTSIFIRNNLGAKKVFQHSKTGSEPNYRLTDKGLEHVKQLLGV